MLSTLDVGVNKTKFPSSWNSQFNKGMINDYKFQMVTQSSHLWDVWWTKFFEWIFHASIEERSTVFVAIIFGFRAFSNHKNISIIQQ